ncbi:clostripain-related cysteine peptidase [Massilibacteroides vaginae]|uniref:clostripain-related cysteine peptidase n=1 Tax=Massilibacteroides vaginae TaxID=1673718 RepID=UPI000A1CCA5D|nr:clostripain-related cysteine peptidase [Massilibacteroides vaginae]
MKYLLSSFLFLALILTGCSDDETPNGPSRTILVYMSSDSDLAGNTGTNLQALKTASSTFDMQNNRLLVYINRPIEPPVLVLVQNGIADTIQTYSINQSSGTKEVLNDIISEVRTKYPAESYGLILWGHGLNWLPNKKKQTFRTGDIYNQLSNNIATPTRPTTKNYGYDKNQNAIELNDLQSAIPDNTFEFILFDACYMGSIEVAYTLRSKSKYIVSSAAEIWDLGFPYQNIFSQLFSQETEKALRSICTSFYNFYTIGEGTRNRDKSATISLVSTDGLSDLALTSRSIIMNNKESLENISLSNIQSFDRRSAFYAPGLISYDLRDYFSHIVDPETLNSFDIILNKTVLFERHTDNLFKYFSDGFDVSTHCGLTLYPYQTLNNKHPELGEWYKQLEWYKAVYE